VAGGLLSASLDLKATSLLSRYLTKGGKFAAGGEVSEGGNPTVSNAFDPSLKVKTRY
jgi:hypothetical protein